MQTIRRLFYQNNYKLLSFAASKTISVTFAAYAGTVGFMLKDSTLVAKVGAATAIMPAMTEKLVSWLDFMVSWCEIIVAKPETTISCFAVRL